MRKSMPTTATLYSESKTTVNVICRINRADDSARVRGCYRVEEVERGRQVSSWCFAVPLPEKKVVTAESRVSWGHHYSIIWNDQSPQLP